MWFRLEISPPTKSFCLGCIAGKILHLTLKLNHNTMETYLHKSKYHRIGFSFLFKDIAFQATLVATIVCSMLLIVTLLEFQKIADHEYSRLLTDVRYLNTK